MSPPDPDQPSPSSEELFEPLLSRAGVLIERITSHGDVTPPHQPYCQDHDEWVMVVSGAARLRVEDHEHTLIAGDHLLIRAGVRHWVTYTSSTPPTVWLAVHFRASENLGH